MKLLPKIKPEHVDDLCRRAFWLALVSNVMLGAHLIFPHAR